MTISTSFPKYDAHLDTSVCNATTNANLTLVMRLGFRQINPGGGAASGTYHDFGDPKEPKRRIIRWDAGAWARWKCHFVETAQQFWNGRFWLVNNFPVLEFTENGTRYRPNIYCRFRLVGSDASRGTQHHHVIDVVRLAPRERWFGSHSTLYDSRDTEQATKATDMFGNSVVQRAHVHEIGHLLGLGHSFEGSAYCPVHENTNAGSCYGVYDAEMQSVMGSGMQLRPAHAYPWRMAITAITGHGRARRPSEHRAEATRGAPPACHIRIQCENRPMHSSEWEPSMQRQYPRTEAEVRSGTRVTSRPSR